MTCQACKDEPRGKRCGSCGKLPPVLEVKTEECPVLFHTVEVEGNIKDNPPEIGRFKNTLAVYKEDDYKILYNSDGIPSNLGNGSGISDFNDLRNRPKYAGEAMTGDTNIPDVAAAVAGEATIREAADERLEGLIGDERTARQEADSGLQTQIDALSAASDVTDIVGTYADLQAYDTSKLNDNDIIKVLQDETHDDETTYYRWIKASNSFSLIGEEGPYYTKAAADAKFQDRLVAGSGITIDPDTNEISADGSETIFYANLNETGSTRHIYKDINFATAASAQDIIDANNNGQVILRGTSLVNPTAYSDSYLQNAFVMPHNNDYEFVFLDRDIRYEYSVSAATDTNFYYYTSEIQPKLTAGSNVQINGTTISATDTTYSNFVGTDGVDAGTAGLVPAPATTDAGKYLKADGTWDTVSAGPNVVQTTGTSQTDVMSQVATSQMIYPSGYETSKTQIAMGPYYSGGNSGTLFSVSSGSASRGRGVYGGILANKSIAILGETNRNECVVIGANAASYASQNTLIGADTYVKNGSSVLENSVALGYSSLISRSREVSVGYGPNSIGRPATRYIANVTDPQLAQDAATKNYTDNLVISYSAINGSAAPTTATEAKYIGQLYYDTTNDDMYYCSAITAQGTDPETYTYTWEALGGGSSGIPTTTTFWGQSYDSVNDKVNGDIIISQTANPTKKAHITSDGFTGNNADIEIGVGATSVSARLKLASNEARLYSDNNTFIRLRSSDGLSLNSKKINSLADPTSAQDAATKNYVDTAVSGVSVPTKTSDLINDGADGTSTYVEATDIADVVYKGTQITTTSPNIISTPMIQDGAVTAAKLGNDVNFLSLTMSTTDIGEGAPLAANTLYGVYE